VNPSPTPTRTRFNPDPNPVRVSRTFTRKVNGKLVGFSYGYIAVKEGDLYDEALIAWADTRARGLKARSLKALSRGITKGDEK